MIRESKLVRLLALLFAFTLVAAACSGSDGDDEGATDGDGQHYDGGRGGRDHDHRTPAPMRAAIRWHLIWAHEQEPPDMHLDDPEQQPVDHLVDPSGAARGSLRRQWRHRVLPELLAEEGDCRATTTAPSPSTSLCATA